MAALERKVTGCPNAAAFDHICFAPCYITQITRVSPTVLVVAMAIDKLKECINEYNTIADLDGLPSLKTCKVSGKYRPQRSTTFIIQGDCSETNDDIKSITTKQDYSYVVLLKKRPITVVQKLFANAARIASIHHDSDFFFKGRTFIQKP